MLFRTRIARRHRALAMVADRDELLGALRAVLEGREHTALVRTETAATARRLAYVFPGQGVQRPGMGRLFYEAVPAFRAEVDRCAEAFTSRLASHRWIIFSTNIFRPKTTRVPSSRRCSPRWPGWPRCGDHSGLRRTSPSGTARARSPRPTCPARSRLADAVSVVGIRARAADEFESGDYAMAVVAADRDTCEDLLARCSGWAAAVGDQLTGHGGNLRRSRNGAGHRRHAHRARHVRASHSRPISRAHQLDQ